jgi:holo-[acyl-carrier protein] synthase
MVTSIGIDVVEISRISTDILRYGQRFIDRILAPGEQEMLKGRHDVEDFISGRFAAKEAIIKALGAYMDSRPALNRIEINRSGRRPPEVHFPEEVEAKLNGARCLISITHERHYAAAVAVIEE